MPCDYRKYPPDWKTVIRPRILRRAGDCCEFCGARNYEPHPRTGSKVILTIAHLDNRLVNHHDSNLAALCQRCHLAHDRALSIARR
jgi:5-methylcytosine-specific restriction endonuclease McrA